MEIAKGFGSATLGKNESGDPMITGRIDGIKYGIYFFDCTSNKDCRSIQFSAGWSTTDKPSWDKINEWNRDKRFGKAFLDTDGDPRIEMDFPLPEVQTSYLEIFFSWWQTALKSFQNHLN
ncbi:MAG: YbjN domain-containing protein [Deltaproteobacteria bacterium]|nr:YbjN domain-containing protein [Deltaproteobacteria bacterium]